jgi:hypothetical protein
VSAPVNPPDRTPAEWLQLAEEAEAEALRWEAGEGDRRQFTPAGRAEEARRLRERAETYRQNAIRPMAATTRRSR